MPERRSWNTAEVRYLRQQIEHMTHAQLGKKLNRSARSISWMASKLGLKRPVNTGHYGLYRRPKGGTGMVPRTAFKPGHKPPKYKEEGEIWEAQHGNKRAMYIKHNNKRVTLHRHIWEKEFGPIPQGYILRFINGNSLDCRLDNLQLVTRREMMAFVSIYRDKQAIAAARWAGKRDFARKVLMCRI